MPTSVSNIDLLRDYILGVSSRANHHARNVQDVAPAVAGHIVANKDNNPIEVHTVSGSMKNVLWVYIRGNKYAFGYDHTSQQIQIRDNSWNGTLRHSIDNSTTHAQLIAIFA